MNGLDARGKRGSSTPRPRRQAEHVAEVATGGLRHEGPELDRDRVDQQIHTRGAELAPLKKAREKERPELEAHDAESRGLRARAETLLVRDEEPGRLDVTVANVEQRPARRGTSMAAPAETARAESPSIRP